MQRQFLQIFASLLGVMVCLTSESVLAQNTTFKSTVGRMAIGLDRRGAVWHAIRYPADEYGAALTGTAGPGPVSAITSLILLEDTQPRTRLANVMTGHNQGWRRLVDIDGDQTYELRLFHRRRPPRVLLGVEEAEVTGVFMPAFRTHGLDPNLETEQKAVSQFLHRYGQKWTITANVFADHHLNRGVLYQQTMDYDRIETHRGGDTKTETIYMPPGQVLEYWHGIEVQEAQAANLARLIALWGGGNRQDSDGMYFERPSRFQSALAGVPRAGLLQVFHNQDMRSSLTTDWDGTAFDDAGDPLMGPAFAKIPAAETGEFMSEWMLGMMFIHFDETGHAPGEAVADRFNPLDLSQHAPATFWRKRAGQGWTNVGSPAPASGDQFGVMTTPWYYKSPYQQYWEDAGWQFTESTVAGAPELTEQQRNWNVPTYGLIAGPFTIAPDQQQSLVATFTAGDLPRAESQRLGRRYLTWVAGRKPSLHPNGENTGLTPLSEVEKYAVLHAVQDTLFTYSDNMFYAWHGGANGAGLSTAAKKDGQGLALMPDPPPSPDILVKPGPYRVEVHAWYPDDEYFRDFDTGVDDFAGWKVYRKLGRPIVNHPDEIKDFGYLDWLLIGTVTEAGAFSPTGAPLGGSMTLGTDHYNAEYTFADGSTRRVFEFFDLSAQTGKDYYYAVTAFDDGSQNTNGIRPGEPLESSRYAYFNLEVVAGTHYAGPVSSSSPGYASSDSAEVVPNPWSLDLGSSKFAGIDPNLILFDKLPGQCTLIIFNETGDKIKTIEHTDGTSREHWNQETDSGQLVVSGLYILAVTKAKDIDPMTREARGNLPNQFVKFVILR